MHNVVHRNVTSDSVYIFSRSRSNLSDLNVRLSDFQSAATFVHEDNGQDVFYISRAQLLERSNPKAASPEVARALWQGPREGAKVTTLKVSR